MVQQDIQRIVRYYRRAASPQYESVEPATVAICENPEAKKLVRIMLEDQKKGRFLRLEQDHSGILPSLAVGDRISRK
jgi:hypothetical protein